jgi:hypothetical protein
MLGADNVRDSDNDTREANIRTISRLMVPPSSAGRELAKKPFLFPTFPTRTRFFLRSPEPTKRLHLLVSWFRHVPRRKLNVEAAWVVRFGSQCSQGGGGSTFSSFRTKLAQHYQQPCVSPSAVVFLSQTLTNNYELQSARKLS